MPDFNPFSYLSIKSSLICSRSYRTYPTTFVNAKRLLFAILPSRAASSPIPITSVLLATIGRNKIRRLLSKNIATIYITIVKIMPSINHPFVFTAESITVSTTKKQTIAFPSDFISSHTNFDVIL